MKDYEQPTTFNLKNTFDEFIMKRCLELARQGLGHTKTNPLVGCVITREEKIISQGYHRFFGGLHAERDAILGAKESNVPLQGATLYVNLEPCCHFGKQPPCVHEIIDQKISRVVVGMEDPNPKMSGRGIQKLKDAGISVEVGVLEAECKKLNAPFLHWMQTGLPYCMGKIAMSLDGKIATSTGQSQWITQEESRRHSHSLRSSVDGILVGIETVLADDPALTCRFGKQRKDPARILLDSKLRIPLHSKILHVPSEAPTFILTTHPCNREKKRALMELPNVSLLVCREKEGHVDLKDALQQLAKENIGTLLVEGGAKVTGSFLQERLFQKLFVYIAPRIIGKGGKTFAGNFNIENLEDTPFLTDIKIKNLGRDLLLEGNYVYGNY